MSKCELLEEVETEREEYRQEARLYKTHLDGIGALLKVEGKHSISYTEMVAGIKKLVANKPVANGEEDKLHSHVEKFVAEQEISCGEDVYQSDRVIENAYEFIEKCADIVGYFKYDDEDCDNLPATAKGE